MTSQEFLYQYLNANAPVGAESQGQQIWLNYVKNYTDSYIIDTFGSVAAIINPEASYKVVIEAHADEISWFVHYITDDGYIYVIRNGGSDALIAPSMKAHLHTKNGIVQGVFGWAAIHVRTDEKDDPKPEVKNIFIDIGCSSKDEVLALGVHVGTIVTFEGDLRELNNRYYVGRALDNRLGGYIIAEVARRLKENHVKLDYALYVVNSVQEEIGLRGAEMMARRIKPDVAVIVDVTHETHSPAYDKKKHGDIKAGKGAVISYAPPIQAKLRDMLIEVAEKNQIPIQRQASSRTTGTDTDSFAYANFGTPAALISIPLKYMHTTVEMAHKDDVEAVIRLFYEFLVQFKAGYDFQYFH
ncbi:MAG: M42 family metallopeptidase [Microscillaceae bacterium]|nr:M42 family metallopeptidase [Microscillaceae bacterium]MDW8460176.1 M42 family metallopeptidase [Cytophagales bacterium]